MDKVIVTIKPNGEVEFQALDGEVAEKKYAGLINGLGEVIKRGHRHDAKTPEHIEQH